MFTVLVVQGELMSVRSYNDHSHFGGHMGFAARVEDAPCGENCNCERHFRPETYARRVPTIDPVTGKRVGSLAAYVFEHGRSP